MPLRFTEKVPDDLDSSTWSERLGHAVKRWMQSAEEALGGLQSPPTTPTEIRAGQSADVGDDQPVALANHVHPIATAVPSKVQISGIPAEGAGAELVRADATFVLDSGGATDGQILVWDAATAGWVPRSIEDIDVLNWMGL